MRFAIAVISLAMPGCTKETPEEAPTTAPANVTNVKVQAYSLGENYKVVLRRDQETLEESLEILRDGKVVHRMEGYTGLKNSPGFSLPALTGDEPLLERVDQDITGDGISNLVVREFTGGMHCCYEDYIFSLEPQFVVFEPIDHRHGGVQEVFVQADDDPALEIKTCDWSFAYWHLPFSESPAPEILLDYRVSSDGRRSGWVFGSRKKPLAGDKRAFYLTGAKRLSQSEEGPTDRVFLPEFTKTILDLIYTGNANFARRYVKVAFEGRDDQRLGYMLAFGVTLGEDRYGYRDGLLELNECRDVAELLAGQAARFGQ